MSGTGSTPRFTLTTTQSKQFDSFSSDRWRDRCQAFRKLAKGDVETMISSIIWRCVDCAIWNSNNPGCLSVLDSAVDLPLSFQSTNKSAACGSSSKLMKAVVADVTTSKVAPLKVGSTCYVYTQEQWYLGTIQSIHNADELEGWDDFATIGPICKVQFRNFEGVCEAPMAWLKAPASDEFAEKDAPLGTITSSEAILLKERQLIFWKTVVSDELVALLSLQNGNVIRGNIKSVNGDVSRMLLTGVSGSGSKSDAAVVEFDSISKIDIQVKPENVELLRSLIVDSRCVLSVDGDNISVSKENKNKRPLAASGGTEVQNQGSPTKQKGKKKKRKRRRKKRKDIPNPHAGLVDDRYWAQRFRYFSKFD